MIDESIPSQKELVRILDLPTLSSLISELTLWYNKASTSDVFSPLPHYMQRSLLSAPVLHSLYLRILSQKAWSLNSSALASFFRAIYIIPLVSPVSLYFM